MSAEYRDVLNHLRRLSHHDLLPPTLLLLTAATGLLHQGLVRPLAIAWGCAEIAVVAFYAQTDHGAVRV